MKKNKRNSIIRILKDRHGSGTILGIGVAVVLLFLFFALLENSRLQSTAQQVRDAVQAAVTETCEEQYADVYDGVREGYSGGYRPSGENWNESLSPADLYARLDTSLGTEANGNTRVKYAGKSVNYRLSGLSAQITNAPFAPDGKNTGQLTCTAEIDLEVPWMFHWNGVPPMHTHLTVKAGYTPKF